MRRSCLRLHQWVFAQLLLDFGAENVGPTIRTFVIVNAFKLCRRTQGQREWLVILGNPRSTIIRKTYDPLRCAPFRGVPAIALCMYQIPISILLGYL